MGPAPAVWNTSDCLAASCGTMVKVWTPNDAASEIKIFEGTAVYSIDFSRNNKVLAVAGDKCQMVMYSSKPHAPNGDRAVGQFPSIPEDTIDAITCVRFSPSDAHLVGGCKNGSVHVWALKAKDDGHVVTGLSGAATSVAVSPNMEVLATASSAGQVLLHDFKTGAKWKSLLRAGGPAAGSLSFSKHAPALATATAAGQLLVWDMDRLELTNELLVHQGAVTGMSFSEASPELLLSCSSDGTFKCTDRRTQKAAWSAGSRGSTSFTALAAKHDGRLLAVGTSSGSVLVHDVRAVQQALSVQQFSDTSASVTAVRWQHLHQSRSLRAASTATTSAAVSAAAPAASAAVSSAATGPRQQQQDLLEQATTVAAPADTIGAGKSPALGEVSSTSASVDLGLRAFSPVQMYDTPSNEADSAAPAAFGTGASTLHTPEASSAAAGASAAVATPVLATPADSMASGPAGGAFMFTPGIGLAQFGGASASTTPVLGTTAELTPMSRPLLAVATGINAAPPLPAPDAAPAAAEPGRLSRRNSSSTAADSRPASAAAAAGKPAGRAPLPSSAAAAGNFHAANAATAAGGGGISVRGAASRSGSSSSLTAAAPSGGSRPGSRPGTAGASGTGATAAGSRRSARGPSDTAAETAAANGNGPGSRPGSAASAGTAQAAAPAAPPAATAADGVRVADGPPSRPASAGTGVSQTGAAVGGLREDVFKAYVDQQMAELRQDVKNMHLDMLRQFHQAQMDLVSVVDGLVQRQDQLAEAVGELTAAVQGMRSAAKQQQAGIGMMPWI